MSLDQILIQLKEVAPHWRRLGEAVGVGRLDEISQYVCQTWESRMPLAYCVSPSLQVGSESDAMVEVVDGWLAQLHPNKPTWREIADVADSIGHHDLALSLRQVYISGDTHGSSSSSSSYQQFHVALARLVDWRSMLYYTACLFYDRFTAYTSEQCSARVSDGQRANSTSSTSSSWNS